MATKEPTNNQHKRVQDSNTNPTMNHYIDTGHGGGSKTAKKSHGGNSKTANKTQSKQDMATAEFLPIPGTSGAPPADWPGRLPSHAALQYLGTGEEWAALPAQGRATGQAAPGQSPMERDARVEGAWEGRSPRLPAMRSPCRTEEAVAEPAPAECYEWEWEEDSEGNPWNGH